MHTSIVNNVPIFCRFDLGIVVINAYCLALSFCLWSASDEERASERQRMPEGDAIEMCGDVCGTILEANFSRTSRIEDHCEG